MIMRITSGPVGEIPNGNISRQLRLGFRAKGPSYTIIRYSILSQSTHVGAEKHCSGQQLHINKKNKHAFGSIISVHNCLGCALCFHDLHVSKVYGSSSDV